MKQYAARCRVRQLHFQRSRNGAKLTVETNNMIVEKIKPQ
jgi:hypothetical protein